MISLNTDICRLLGIDYPIIQAGMAGGPTTAELVSEVSEAGALGTLGAAYLTPDKLREDIAEIRDRTNKPFAVNLFAPVPKDDFSRITEVKQALQPIYEELAIEGQSAEYRSPDHGEELFRICLELNVPTISTAFGSLSPEHMASAKAQGVTIITMATTVGEALDAQAAGADAIVAQGSEAGGHRGSFSFDRHPMGAQVGLMALLPQVADTVDVPVIAAGGIADGRGLVASLALGAQAVQVGTRFVAAKESGAHKAYKQAIFDSDEESTVVTKSFSGRPARGIKNYFIEQFESSGTKPLPFPSQNTVTKEIRGAAAKAGNPEFMSLWAGQATRAMTQEEGAAEIVSSMMDQARTLLW
ncbi:nitronate monooxygenase [Planococcus sp. CP5-4]|uniref:NAD(P)H-dependent flavin oxidoreductase n=1 Tax=unclassified Planococcus (in: firmicutes) TaxID=2662419 RepID=UPI001C23557E|nr:MULTISPECIES: nitronate monooxygenase [unclassified Planococcus (in: firmicutes)]MBU9672422.1 nitronate monooxygenase [Planococcus sp. CP5-4_YE]MBV0909473.1 nitronate monooxygenase [Planococcus sp. CP5-4_UN]MBW6064202.1 nitronate monooxygenase [Planococcus sp. CP5-4]